MENDSLNDQVIDINLNGVARTFRAALSHVKARQGYLLAVSSMAAFVHSPLNTAYTASKAGVWALCDSLRLELRRHRIFPHRSFEHSLTKSRHEDRRGALV
ncbi:SDR family NAD(P)-dependent oxidoreductase [Pseudomonas sp. RHF3.3-3]|uniref:SDR family NAD(P)-dependent oxidoreductase n=1 Tax=Pseudomonas sp. RHF3.3-3 TaxID=3396624 RepID=UPI003A845F54